MVISPWRLVEALPSRIEVKWPASTFRPSISLLSSWKPSAEPGNRRAVPVAKTGAVGNRLPYFSWVLEICAFTEPPA
ncbi:hypothetical protein D3C84_998450 [compost metagenome]